MTHYFSIVCHPNSESVTRFSNYLSDSGHGGQTPDLDGDEANGYDQGEDII